MRYLYLPLAALGGYMFLFSTLTTEHGERLRALHKFADGAPVRHTFTHIPLVDRGLQFIVSFFYEYIDGSNPDSQAFALYFFLSLLAPALGIWAVESSRGGGRRLLLWTVVMQATGFCTISPFFYFFRCTREPALPPSSAMAIAPALALSYVLPTLLMFAPSAPLQRQAAIAFWQAFPVWYSLCHWGFSRALAPAAKPRSERAYVERVYTLVTLVSLTGHGYLLWYVLGNADPWERVKGVFWPGGVAETVAQVSILMLRGDWTIGLLATLAWTVGRVWSVMGSGVGKRVGVVLGVMVGAVVLSPGVVIAECWRWREVRLREGREGKKSV